MTTTTQDLAALLGRLLLGLGFVWDGFGKAMATAATIEYFGKLGLPVPPAAYGVSVAVELVIGAVFVLGIFNPWPALILAAWCIATAFVAHSNLADRNSLFHFIKNFAICGGFLYAAALGPGRYSLHGLFGSRNEPATS